MDRWHRRSIRLAGYDYAQPGAYFVTICTQNRECMFGNVRDGSVDLSHHGESVQRAWDSLSDHYPHVDLDAFIIMPNHIHGVIVLSEATQHTAARRTGRQSTRHGLPEIVRAFKSFSARHVNVTRATPGARVWQRNYYEHIIRSEMELGLIRQYVVDNPLGWDTDPENPVVRRL